MKSASIVPTHEVDHVVPDARAVIWTIWIQKQDDLTRSIGSRYSQLNLKRQTINIRLFPKFQVQNNPLNLDRSVPLAFAHLEMLQFDEFLAQSANQEFGGTRCRMDLTLILCTISNVQSVVYCEKRQLRWLRFWFSIHLKFGRIGPSSVLLQSWAVKKSFIQSRILVLSLCALKDDKVSQSDKNSVPAEPRVVLLDLLSPFSGLPSKPVSTLDYSQSTDIFEMMKWCWCWLELILICISVL